jgi:hypothetical protein
MRRKHLAALAVATLSVTGFAACGDDDDDTPDDVETPGDTGVSDTGMVTLPTTPTS